MVFIATKITSFFREATQMCISARTCQALEDEGISTVSNLHVWEYDEGDQFTQKCNLPPKIVDPTNNQALINQPAFKVPFKSLKRLEEASRIGRFYDNVGCDISQPNMRWNQVINKFMI